ncbi:MAG TPA: hypothetical protein VGP90_08815 [Acidimicrobiia bacterium]|nr:hypothetical protein [Acidimicrobiia bacterium]
MTEPTRADLLAKLHAETRIPPASLIQKVNKGTFEADAVGHADTTDMLLAHDPEWSWEPFALDDKGQPLVMYDAGGRPRAMWIRLTIHGHTRIGVGTCSPTAGDPYKELIGDALRNAAMRFGVALALWSKSQWPVEAPEEPQPGKRPLTATRGSANKDNASRAGSSTGKVSQLPAPTDNDVARHPAAGPVLPKDQALAKHADDLGLDDLTRKDVVLAITKGRTASGKDLEPQEVIWVAAALEDLAEGVVELRYDPDGTPRLGRVRHMAGDNPGPPDDRL